MSNPNNTLLGRCALAYQESFFFGSSEHLCSMAAVFEHLAAEISFLQQCSEISLHDFAKLLRDEAAQIPDRYHEPESK
jgi:hypothetical protein